MKVAGGMSGVSRLASGEGSGVSGLVSGVAKSQNTKPQTPDAKLKTPNAKPQTRNPFSFFLPPVSNTRPFRTLGLTELRDLIAGPEYRGITEELRSLKDPGEQRSFKASRFAYVTFSGSFSRRNEKSLLQHSGLIAIDLDHLPYLDEARQLLLQDPVFETQMLFVSPSGNGLKWILAFDPQLLTQKEFFLKVADHLQRRYRLHPDPAAKDVPRASFIPHDPEVYLKMSIEY